MSPAEFLKWIAEFEAGRDPGGLYERSIRDIIRDAADSSDVPRDLLVALARTWCEMWAKDRKYNAELN